MFSILSYFLSTLLVKILFEENLAGRLYVEKQGQIQGVQIKTTVQKRRQGRLWFEIPKIVKSVKQKKSTNFKLFREDTTTWKFYIIKNLSIDKYQK